MAGNRISNAFNSIVGKFVSKDMINEENGAIYVEAGDELTLEYGKEGDVVDGKRINRRWF